MALMDFFRKKSSGDVAKDRLKLLLSLTGQTVPLK